MTDLEFSNAFALVKVRMIKALLEDVADNPKIGEEAYTHVRSALRSWETQLQDGLNVRKAPRRRDPTPLKLE